jgi:hypothetical protein
LFIGGNSGVLANAKEPRNHQRSKHIEHKYHLLREIVQCGDVKVCKISTFENLVDPFTKSLPVKIFRSHLKSMGIFDMYHLVLGKWGVLLVMSFM